MKPIFLPISQKLAVAICGLCFSLCSWGLGVSDIELSSHLGEPLKAQIKLRDTGDLGKDQIIVRLAPKPIFEKMGIERNYQALSLKFEIDDQQIVHVKTSKPINEPYMNFVIEVKWPEGQLYREYKLFLDPASHTQ